MKVLHWLFDIGHPIQWYGIVPFTIWMFIFSIWAFTFGPAEYAGGKRWHGMCYATDILRCLPRAFWLAAVVVAFIHFDFHRKTVAVVQHLIGK
jgi:hypothetical protein